MGGVCVAMGRGSKREGIRQARRHSPEEEKKKKKERKRGRVDVVWWQGDSTRLTSLREEDEERVSSV